MLEIFKAPVFEDNEQGRKAQILHSLIKGTMLIISIEVIIFISVLPQNYLRWIMVVSLIDIPGLVFLFLNKKGFTTLASGLFAGLCIGIVVIMASTAGGLRAPAWQIIPVLVLMVGLTRGWKAGVGVGLFLSICGLGFVFAEYWNILPDSKVTHNTFTLWLGSLTSIALVTWLQFNTVENLNKAFKKVNEELKLRKVVENELSASETFRKLVFESSRIPIVVMEAVSNKFIDCNQAAINIYKFHSKDEVLGKTPMDVSPDLQYDGSNSSDKAKFYINKALCEGSIVFEWKHQRPNYELWDAEVHLMSFEADNKQLLQFTLLDITERIKTKKSLDESESRIKSISNNFSAGMIYQVIINQDGSRNFTYLSESVEKLYGISAEKAMLDSNLIYTKIHPDDIQPLKLKEEEAIKNLSVFKFEARVINPSGDIRWSSFVSTPKLLADGSLCFDGIEFIISERKQAEEAYRISTTQLKANLDNTPNVAVQWYDQDGKVLYWNPASEKMYGWSSSETIGKTLDLLIHTPEETAGFLKILHNIRETGQPFGPYEARIARRDGTNGWVWATTFSFPMGDGKLGFACMDVDITDRKKTEGELMESEERFKALSTIASEGLMIHEKGIIVDVNQAFVKLLGYTSVEELIGKSGLEVTRFTPESKQLVLGHIQSNSNETYDVELVHLNGKIIAAETKGEDIVYRGKKARLVYMRDISDRKLFESALKESEERFKTLSAIASEGLMIHENGIMVDMNQVFASLQGYSTIEELIGKVALDTIQFTPESKQLVYDHFISKSDETFDIEIINQDGKIIPAETRGSEIVYKGRKANLVYMRDISDRKKAEQKVKESEELFKNLIDLTPYAISLNDFQGRYLMVNKAFCDDWGFEANEVIGKQKEEIGLYVDEELEESMKNEILQKGFCKNIEGSIHSNQGKTIYALFSSRVIQMNNENVLLTSSVNITEKKKIEKELEKYRNQLEILVKERTDELAATNEELNASNEELVEQREELQASLTKLHEAQKTLIQSEKMASLGILSAGIAHEINNPLNFIQGGIYAIENYLKKNISEQTKSLHPFVNAINEGVKRATAIVTSLNHYSRSDNLPMVECNFHAIIDNCLIILQNQLKNKVEINKKYTDKAPLIFGNEGKLHQAVLNIISNAEQAIESGGIIEITTDIIDNQLIVIVTDSGCGISAQNLKKVFDPFFTTKAPGKGTGLGLSITYNIIQEHRGTIEFESNPDQGTKVTIKLPTKPN